MDVSQTMSVDEAVQEAMRIDGAVSAAIADWDSGMALASYDEVGELVSAGYTDVLRSVFKVVRLFEGDETTLEDVVLTLNDNISFGIGFNVLIKPLQNYRGLFLVLGIDTAKGNPGMARYKVTQIERRIAI